MIKENVNLFVKGAVYLPSVDGICIVLLDSENNEHNHVIYSNQFSFEENMNKQLEMEKLAKLMIGKYICVEKAKDIYDDNLIKKILQKNKL